MKSIAITGGIGVGKSYVCRRLEAMGVPVLYTDAEARRLMVADSELRAALERLTGRPVVDSKGQLLKLAITEFIASEGVQAINALVWPRVRGAMKEWIVKREERLVAVECALLYEAGWEGDFDMVVLVDAPRDVRIARVMARDGKTEREVEQWIGRQGDEGEKRQRADRVVVNDGVADVDKQLRELIDGIV